MNEKSRNLLIEQILNLRKIGSVVSELRSDKQTDRRSDKQKLLLYMCRYKLTGLSQFTSMFLSWICVPRAP